ncbi:superoxide dismutase family protein [Deinococcus sp. QL22]|uniref:superoxide dismutase family protein n=1 Tax=Deinococcus sp. QL22 TaxID=2939437 RepID=UPI002017FF68|nr:superoxide dismutase family protein [Deinococcus sp. QL22]UQN06869.1 superoxide dismutase family protein [Deinococcus sp. QL22]
MRGTETRLKRLRWTTLGVLTLGLAAAGGAEMVQMMAPATTPLTANAAITDEQGQVRGLATFRQAGTAVAVTVEARGLTPGQHGMHVHDTRKCLPGVDPAVNRVVPFGAAGPHFDSGMSRNHDSPEAGNKYGHSGDLPMLTVGADGVGRASFMSDKISLTGMDGILNRTLIIHEKPDDYKSDPSGMTGARVRCGTIVRVGLNTRDYPLPGVQTYPEGVAYDAKRGVLYTGSAATGAIYTVNPTSGTVNLFSEGGALGRSSALGLKVDSQSRVWVAGGATGTVSVLRPDGFPVAILETPKSPNPYINDLAPAADGSVYVTDSTRPVIFRVSPDLKLSAWLDLGNTPIKYGPGINLNGILATPDGRYLLTMQLNTGDLWRIDLRTKAVKKVMGGLTRGDGILLNPADPRTLYVARNAMGVVSKVALSADSGTGTLVAEEPLQGLRFPATLAAVDGDVVVTQSQLDKLIGGTPETPFRLTRFKAF